MKKIVNILFVFFYIPVLLVFFTFSEKEKKEYLMYLKALKCPYKNLVGFVWIFRKFPEYRNLLYKRRGGFLSLILSWIYKKERTLYLLPDGANIGNNLMIWHGFSTIINAQSIGDNCSIWQQVTIGNKLDDIESKPVIGNNVKICAGSIVVGNIKIGNNVIIGAGSVVTKDVPSNCVIAGVPAKIIKKI